MSAIQARQETTGKRRKAAAIILALAVLAAAAVVELRPHRPDIAVDNDSPARPALQLTTAKAANNDRPSYRYSVIPGGALSGAELESAIQSDPVVASHYANFDVAHTYAIRLERPKHAFLSYRIDDHVYWTRQRILIPAGELVLTDGSRMARARCGNQIADEAGEVSPAQPSIAAFDEPLQSRSAATSTPGAPTVTPSGSLTREIRGEADTPGDSSQTLASHAPMGDSAASRAASVLAEIRLPGGAARMGLAVNPSDESTALLPSTGSSTAAPGVAYPRAFPASRTSGAPAPGTSAPGAPDASDSASGGTLSSNPVNSLSTGTVLPEQLVPPEDGAAERQTSPIDLENPPVDAQAPPDQVVAAASSPDERLAEAASDAVPVPEPATLLLLLSGVVLGAAHRLRGLRSRRETPRDDDYGDERSAL